MKIVVVSTIYYCIYSMTTWFNIHASIITNEDADNIYGKSNFDLFLDAVSLEIPLKINHRFGSESQETLFKSELKNSEIKVRFVQIDSTKTRNKNIRTRNGKQMIGGGGGGDQLVKPNKQISNNPESTPINSDSIESSAEELKLSLKYISSIDRFNEQYKHQIRRYIFDMFHSFGLKPIKHIYKAPKLEHSGINIVGIKPGSARKGQQIKNNDNGEDQILLIGAHYDAVNGTNGTNDNGSGLAVMLEIIRLLDYYQCELKYTVMFVAFDQEELGAIGSKYFVNDYLIPNELMPISSADNNNNTIFRNSKFNGAIIMDTVLNFDPNPNSQDVSNDIHKFIPEASILLKANNYVGDFMALFARTKVDEHLSELISKKWQQDLTRGRIGTDNHQLHPILIRTLSTNKVASKKNIRKHRNMLRSDHMHFWYHNHTNYDKTLSAVLLTDTGPFRGYMRQCYHQSCDDIRFLTPRNVNFIKRLTDVLTQVILDSNQGKCYAGELKTPNSTVSKLNRNITTFKWLKRKPRNNRLDFSENIRTNTDQTSNLMIICNSQEQKRSIYQIVKIVRLLFESLKDPFNGSGSLNPFQDNWKIILRNLLRSDNNNYTIRTKTTTNSNSISKWRKSIVLDEFGLWKSIVCDLYRFADSMIGIGSILLILNDF